MKDLHNFINERGPAPIHKDIKTTNGNGCVQVVKEMIDHLLQHPDYKGKDKELWSGAAYFLYDYLKELKNSDYEEIVRELDLPDLRNDDKEEFSAAAVQGAIALKLQN